MGAAVTATVDLDELLDELDVRTAEEFKCKPEVVDADDDWDLSELPLEQRTWLRISDVVAVVVDLKNSSKLGTGQHAASTASIYEAAVGGAVAVFETFDADFIDIQGDAAFGLFWSDGRYARAVCAAITVKTFSNSLVTKLTAKWESIPATGFKVGIAASPILVKRIGTPDNPDHQAPVWAGRSVNYAAKAASASDAGQLVATGSVWDWIENNDYLTFTCDCTEPVELWEDITIDGLREGDDAEAQGRMLASAWCTTHGAAFCDAILAGKATREQVGEKRHGLVMKQMADAVRLKALNERKARRARMAGVR